MWIETRLLSAIENYATVTPHVGVWIETTNILVCELSVHVTPHVGVWIETYLMEDVPNVSQGHTSCRCVD